MKAIEKLDTLTVKVVHAEVEVRKPGTAVETVYRWRSALRSGRGVADPIKRLLIEATRATAQPIQWADFEPVAGEAHQ